MAIRIPAVHADEPCPLPGYEQLAIRALQNPSGAIYEDILYGALGGSADPRDGETDAAYTSRMRERDETRERLGRALVAFYGPAAQLGMDFSTPAAAVASIEDPELPGEIAEWLLTLPIAIVMRRRELISKNLFSSSGSAS